MLPLHYQVTESITLPAYTPKLSWVMDEGLAELLTKK